MAFIRLAPIGGGQIKRQMIVEAVKLLFENNVKVNTLFVGNGGAREELEILINQYGLQDYFKFYGPSYGEEKLGFKYLRSMQRVL